MQLQDSSVLDLNNSVDFLASLEKFVCFLYCLICVALQKSHTVIFNSLCASGLVTFWYKYALGSGNMGILTTKTQTDVLKNKTELNDLYV